MRLIPFVLISILCLSGIAQAQSRSYCSDEDVLIFEWDFNDSAGPFGAISPVNDQKSCASGFQDWIWGPYDNLPPSADCEGNPITHFWGTVLGASYNDDSWSRLFGPCLYIDDDDYEFVTLEICHWYQTHGSVTEGDGGNVVVPYPLCDPNGDGQWLPVCGGHPYDGLVNTFPTVFACLVDGTMDPPPDTCFNGASGNWVKSFLDLTPWLGIDFMFAFDFGSDYVYSPDPGWYIKWVRIWGQQPTDVEETDLDRDPGTDVLEVIPAIALDEVRIRFDMPRDALASVAVYNHAGRKVSTVFHGHLPSGSHLWTWVCTDDAGRSVPAGTYFVRVSSDRIFWTKKIMITE
jgi:hypothetical protein